MRFRSLAEISALVQARERESLTLDYKGDFSGDPERAKKELAKDVAAFANSQGGAIILGVDEQKGIPCEPITGVPALLDGRQKITDWLEQTLNQNIAQRVAATIRQFDLPDVPDRCVVTIEIAPSPRAPHMVTYQQDNRYYRRYFKRHQFESLVAAEYEVREMFMRSLRYRDEAEALLARRRYLDRFEEGFGVNDYTRRLARMDGQQKAEGFAVFIAVPTVLDDSYIQAPSDTLRAWHDRHQRRYGLPAQSRSTLDGVLLLDPVAPDGSSPLWREYVFVARNGFIEYGTARGFGRPDADGVHSLHLSLLMGRYWAFLAVVSSIYQTFGIGGSLRILCNVTEARKHYLTGFGERWADDRQGDYLRPSPPPLDHHLQIVQEIDNVELDEAQIEALVRATDQRLEQAFGHEGLPRSFNHPHSGDSDFAGTRYISMR